VVPQLQAFGEGTDRRRLSASKSLQLQEQEILLGLDAGLPSCQLA
jgi:hypothetical protein